MMCCKKFNTKGRTYHSYFISERLTSSVFLAILSLMIAVLLLVHLVGTISANTEDKAIQFDEVVVEPDDTLWGIAQKYRPNEDPRRVVWYIKKINQCGSTIYPGQTVKIPVL